jgi:hypothetical protein
LAARLVACLLGLCLALPATAAEVQVEGFYRARARGFTSLTIDPSLDASEGFRAWAQHRLWVQPRFVLSDNVAIYTEVRALDGMAWGEAPSLERDPFGAADDDETDTDRLPSIFSDDLREPNVYPADGLPRTSPNLQLWRAWGEVHGELGTFRFGRMPVDWGLGVWQNDGLGLNADYGDSADRIQWDKAFDDVFLRVAVEVDSYALATAATRDIVSANVAAAYRSERVEIGANVQLRQSFGGDEGDFTLATVSASMDAEVGNLHVGAELVGRYGGGAIDAVLDDARVQSFGGVLVGELAQEKLTLGVEIGMASGDKDPTDQTLGTFTFDRDYNVALIMFEQPMPLFRDAATDARNLDLAISGNGISNAVFARAEASYVLDEDLVAEVAVIGARTFQRSAGRAGQNVYGLEIDPGVRYRAHEHVDLLGHAAFFLPGSYYRGFTDADLAPEGLDGFVIGGQIIGRIHF